MYYKGLSNSPKVILIIEIILKYASHSSNIPTVFLSLLSACVFTSKTTMFVIPYA